MILLAYYGECAVTPTDVMTHIQKLRPICEFVTHDGADPEDSMGRQSERHGTHAAGTVSQSSNMLLLPLMRRPQDQMTGKQNARHIR